VAGFAAIATIASFAGSACHRFGNNAARGNSVSVLLVTIDTLRADHLRAYSATGTETPAASRIAREGIRFTAAYTPVPLTLPAHSSIMTGLQPFTHGVRDNGGFYLEPSHRTLATILKEHGFQTAAFVSAFVLDSRWGLGSGFDEYFDRFEVSTADLAAMARVQRPGGDTWRQARSWLDDHVQDRFFVWLHLFDPHTPYTPPEPFQTRYADRPYDGEIAYADSIVGEVLQYLEQHGVLDRTIVVFLSDHGEGLGDHGEDEHGLLLFDSTLHVPWMIRLPNRTRAGAAIDRPVSLIDVTPTILGLLGISTSQPFDGLNLAPLVTGVGTVHEEALYAETYFPRLHFDWSELTSLRDDRYKLIRSPRSRLYDYRADPTESHDLSVPRAAVVSALDRTLTAITARHASAPPIARGLDPDAAQRLGSLGYIGTGISDRALVSATRPDPSDKAGLYRSLTRARALLEKGESEAGTRELRRIVLEDPELEPARRLLREYWLEHRQIREGLDWFGSAAARRTDSPALLVEVGRFERAAGRLDQAIATFDQALAKQNDSIEALTAAAEALRQAGQNERALDLFKRAASKTSDAPPRMRVAETLIKMGRLTEADQVLSSALAVDSHISGAHYLLAQIAEQQHDLQRAEREYRLEMALSTWDYRAPFNLAALVGGRNDHAEQVGLLESIPRIAPQFPEVYFYLAKALLDLGNPSRLPEAIAAADSGLRLAPRSASAPLGHYVLADIYQLEGRPADSQRELRAGQELEQQLGARSAPHASKD
jgi:arylsulfatase A-like enzyme/tetratricopeptide (TPR) repeat protein